MRDMPNLPADLAAMVAQRLCHDLVNPLGALGNGLELIEMTQAPTPETVLMRDSLEQALGRIKLYRLAFGPAGDGEVPGPEVAATLRALGGSRPVEVSASLPAFVTRNRARLIALMALCAETAMAWGGKVQIADDGDSLSLRAEATRLRLDAELWDALARGQAPQVPNPPQVHFALLATAAQAADRALDVRTEETELHLAL